MKKYMVGYQAIIDCSVIVKANNPEEAVKEAMDGNYEPSSFELGEIEKSIWKKAGADEI